MCPTANLCAWWKGAEFPFHFCTRQCSQNWFAWFAPRLNTKIAMFTKNLIWTQPVNSLRKHSIPWGSTLNTNTKALRTAEVPGMMKRLRCISFGQIIRTCATTLWWWQRHTPSCQKIRATRICIGPAVALKIWAVKQFAKLVNSPLLQDGVGGKLSTQWSMVNACTPQGEPILGTGGEKKYVHWFRMKFQIALTPGKKCRSLQKVYSSDDGISLPLAMVPNLCIDKKLGVDSPRCAVSFPRIGIGQMDSKQELFAPGAVQVNLQCAMLISSAAYTHTVWPRLQSSCLCEGSGPIVPAMQNFRPFEGPVGVWWRCYNWPTKFPKKDVKCIKLFLVQCTVTTSKTNHCWHAMSWQPPARRTTWFPCWTTFGRTFAHRQPVPR